MKWINQLSLFFGVQDLPSDDSDDNSYEFNLLQGQLQIQDQLPPLSEGEGEGKDNELNHFLTLPLSSRDRLLLRDVQTSAKGLLAHPRFTLFSNLGDDRNNSRNNGGLEHPYIRLSVELRDQNNDDKPIQIKCAQFDRVIGHGGLLFYVEILDKSAQDQMEGQQSAFKTLLCPGVCLFPSFSFFFLFLLFFFLPFFLSSFLSVFLSFCFATSFLLLLNLLHVGVASPPIMPKEKRKDRLHGCSLKR